MSGQKLPAKFNRFRPQAVYSLIAGLLLLSIVWIGSPKTGASQQPNTGSVKPRPVSSPATSDPLISLSAQEAKPVSLENTLAQGPAKGRSNNSKSEDSKSDYKSKRSNASQSQPGSRSVPEISAADETAVISFVKEHHTQLADVLQSLKSRHAQAYARAIADLNRTRERLEQLQNRDEARYERELEMWKTKSRIQLLVVRIKMNPEDAALRHEFKSLVGRQVEQHKEQLLSERQRIEQRLAKIDEQLEKLSENSDQLIERQMKQWLASGDFALRKQAAKGRNPQLKSSQSQQAKFKTKKSATVPVRTETKKDAEP